MRIVRNESTKTIHKPVRQPSTQPTACGALRHVADDHIRETTQAEIGRNDESDYCGRCFDDAGGY